MQPILVRFGGYQPPASIHNQAAAVMGRALAARLGAAVRFELQGNVVEAGHQAADLLTQVENGTRTLCYFSASYLAGRVPEIALLDLPFVLQDRARAHAVLDGPLGRILSEKLAAATGYRLLGWWDNGFRHLSNRVRPIRVPAHCRGLRIRTLFSETHRRAFELMGFEPVALDVKDMLEAVRSGAVDAQENPLTNFRNFGIDEHHRHITLSRHFFGAAALLCHKASYDAWPAEVQDAMSQAAAEAGAAQRRLAAAQDDAVLAQLRPAQNDVVPADPSRTGAVRAGRRAAGRGTAQGLRRTPVRLPAQERRRPWPSDLKPPPPGRGPGPSARSTSTPRRRWPSPRWRSC